MSKSGVDGQTSLWRAEKRSPYSQKWNSTEQKISSGYQKWSRQEQLPPAVSEFVKALSKELVDKDIS